MAKPSVTLRSGKGSALTYSELDANFTNLKDATITLTAGSGGTAVSADLNGTITFVAGSNVTLTGDNSAKTITIASSGGSGGVTNPLTANLDIATYSLITTAATDRNFVIAPDGTGAIEATSNKIRVGKSTGPAKLTTNYSVTELELSIQDAAATSGLVSIKGENQNLTITPHGTGKIVLNGATKFASTSGTPTTYQNGYYDNMLQTPVSWLKIDIGGSNYYIPLFQ